ncbi:hypothetical protein QM646_06035 [Rhodococcus erythropolis]|nr:hypothetical protein [Rhodococcus erythropolis]
MDALDIDAELNAALAVEDWQESISRVKSVVSNSFRTADKSVEVVRTEHFNHSNIPDLVLEWPDRGSSRRRYVYLRPTQDPDQIAEDVSNHAADRPIFIHLSELRQVEAPTPLAPSMELLSTAARSSQSLVTEISAVTRLSSSTSSPAARLLPSSVLRGGRGLIEEDQAASAALNVGVGFDGAMEADREATAQALATIDAVLAPAEATELTSFLEAVWIASGGGATDFPGPNRDLGSKLPASRLKLFLDLIDSESVDFWSKVGESVDLDSFVDLNLVGSQKALQILVSSALPSLQARTCLILPTERSDQESDPFLWQVEEGVLSLRGFGRQAWVANRKEQFPLASDEDVRPSPTTFSTRAKDANISISTVELSVGDRSLVYRGESEDNIADDEIIATLDEALGAGSKVNQAVALLDEHRPLTVNFRNNVSAGHSSSRFDVSALLSVSWSLLNSIDPNEEIALREVLQIDIDENDDNGLESDSQSSD